MSTFLLKFDALNAYIFHDIFFDDGVLCSQARKYADLFANSGYNEKSRWPVTSFFTAIVYLDIYSNFVLNCAVSF